MSLEVTARNTRLPAVAVHTVSSFSSLLKGCWQQNRNEGVPGKAGMFAKLLSVERIRYRSSLAHVNS